MRQFITDKKRNKSSSLYPHTTFALFMLERCLWRSNKESSSFCSFDEQAARKRIHDELWEIYVVSSSMWWCCGFLSCDKSTMWETDFQCRELYAVVYSSWCSWMCTTCTTETKTPLMKYDSGFIFSFCKIYR